MNKKISFFYVSCLTIVSIILITECDSFQTQHKNQQQLFKQDGMFLLPHSDTPMSCQVLNVNKTVQHGTNNLTVNFTVHGYFSKTSTNKIMQTWTGVASGNCTNNISYIMPANNTKTVVVTAVGNSVLHGPIVKNVTMIVDGTASHRWENASAYNTVKCSGYFRIIVVNSTEKQEQQNTEQARIQQKHIIMNDIKDSLILKDNDTKKSGLRLSQQ